MYDDRHAYLGEAIGYANDATFELRFLCRCYFTRSILASYNDPFICVFDRYEEKDSKVSNDCFEGRVQSVYDDLIAVADSRFLLFDRGWGLVFGWVGRFGVHVRDKCFRIFPFDPLVPPVVKGTAAVVPGDGIVNRGIGVAPGKRPVPPVGPNVGRAGGVTEEVVPGVGRRVCRFEVCFPYSSAFSSLSLPVVRVVDNTARPA